MHGKSPDRKFYCIACHMLLSKNCVGRDYSLISLVLAMVRATVKAGTQEWNQNGTERNELPLFTAIFTSLGSVHSVRKPHPLQDKYIERCGYERETDPSEMKSAVTKRDAGLVTHITVMK